MYRTDKIECKKIKAGIRNAKDPGYISKRTFGN
jgi:hypothetical protein